MLHLYNSLTRIKQQFEPFDPKQVTVYTCGPTVYDYVTIGNWRTYTLGDLIVRTLKYLGYDVRYVMNITDVGHLTGDNLGDADTGEDRLEKGAAREGKSAWDVAKFYTDDFLKGCDQLNLTKPDKFTKATDYIDQQIDLVKKIEAKGFAYHIDDGIYFDVKAYELAGYKYGELSTLDQRKEGSRIAKNPQKKDPRDFALWKFSPKDKKRQMEWESPWGMGFPGWHIECSAMCMAELGEQIDIHIGGEDLRSTHHPNEIVQSEAATGKKPFVRYWLHGAFLQVDGGRMGKSLGNAYNLHDIVKKGFDPLALRYFYLTGHYRKPLNFTWEALETAQNVYRQLVLKVQGLKAHQGKVTSVQAQGKDNLFKNALKDDLSMSWVLANVQTMLKDKQLPDQEKLGLIEKWDQVLGLKLIEKTTQQTKIPTAIIRLQQEREKLRQQGKYQEADQIRDKIAKKGYTIKDTAHGTRITRKPK